ncbi:MAG: hypothetical protein WBL85_08000 [Sedimentisphaerales bacterium]
MAITKQHLKDRSKHYGATDIVTLFGLNRLFGLINGDINTEYADNSYPYVFVKSLSGTTDQNMLLVSYSKTNDIVCATNIVMHYSAGLFYSDYFVVS